MQLQGRGQHGKGGQLTEKLAPPAAPVRLLMPLRVTRLAICLQARAMELITVASSLSMLPACSSCMCRRSSSGLAGVYLQLFSSCPTSTCPQEPGCQGGQLVLALGGLLGRRLQGGCLQGSSCSSWPCLQAAGLAGHGPHLTPEAVLRPAEVLLSSPGQGRHSALPLWAQILSGEGPVFVQT